MRRVSFINGIKKYKFFIFIILFFVILLIISSINIIEWLIDKKNIEKQIDNIDNIVNVDEITDTSETEIIEPIENVDKSNPYWDYIKMNMIDVDFSELKKSNKDTVGWIKVNGTNINYPFVQTTDNDYYLTHAFNKKVNKAGWVFMDYRNNSKMFDKNTIIYAHGRSDTTMFGSLKNIVKSNWFDDPNNFIIKLSTESENTLWQVFSVYQIPTTSDYLQIKFNNDNDYQEFLNKLINRSSYNFNTIVGNNDIILSLSTCYNDNERVVMHGKLIKREKK